VFSASKNALRIPIFICRLISLPIAKLDQIGISKKKITAKTIGLTESKKLYIAIIKLYSTHTDQVEVK
jgi:hypothetical protein